MIWNIDSSRLTSTTWPSPVRSAWRSAASVAKAPTSAVTSSVTAIGGSSGGPSGSPSSAGKAAQRLGDGGEAGMLRVRSVLAEAADAQDDQTRIALQQSPRDRNRAPRACPAACSRSAHAASARAARDRSCPASVLRSSVTTALLRLTSFQKYESVLARSGPAHAARRDRRPAARP